MGTSEERVGWEVLRRLDEGGGRRLGGAAGRLEAVELKRARVPSDEADMIFWVGEWTEI